MEQFLNNINENNVSQKEIFSENCIICLSSLIEKQLPINSQIISNQENDDMIKITQECGHSFHKKCIEEWFKSEEICPLCKEHFEDSTDVDEIKQKIMSIQAIVNPLINQCEFYYEGSRIMYKKQPLVYPPRNKFFSKSNKDSECKRNHHIITEEMEDGIVNEAEDTVRLNK